MNQDYYIRSTKPLETPLATVLLGMEHLKTYILSILSKFRIKNI